MQTVITANRIPVYENSRSQIVTEWVNADTLTKGIQKKVNGGEIERVYKTRNGHLVARDIWGRPLTDLIAKAPRKLTIDLILTSVSLVGGGAPRGRVNVGTPPKNPKLIYDSRVNLYGDYDKGGAYWGSTEPGEQLRVKYTKDLQYIEFYRKGH